MPKEADFSRDGTRVLCLSKKGQLQVWSLDPLEAREKIEFRNEATRLIVLQRSDHGFCIFKRDLEVLDLSQSQARVVDRLKMRFLREITDARANKDESMLAVAFARDRENQTEIRLFKVDFPKTLVSIANIVDISTDIEVMDFSVDNMYLMYKEIGMQKVFYDLLNFKPNDVLGQLFDPPFMSTGLVLSPSVAQLANIQTDGNELSVLVLAGRKSLLVGDNYGTIRVFDFPCKNPQWGKIYPHHVAEVSSLKVSSDGNWALSASSYDRYEGLSAGL